MCEPSSLKPGEPQLIKECCSKLLRITPPRTWLFPSAAPLHACLINLPVFHLGSDFSLPFLTYFFPSVYFPSSPPTYWFTLTGGIQSGKQEFIPHRTSLPIPLNSFPKAEGLRAWKLCPFFVRIFNFLWACLCFGQEGSRLRGIERSVKYRTWTFDYKGDLEGLEP